MSSTGCHGKFPEGITEVATRAMLKYYVDEGLFTLDQLNEKIKHFHFGHFKNNKPDIILYEHVQRDSNLKQSASQMLALAHSLPFLLSEWIEEEN